MAYPTISEKGVPPLLDNLKAKKVIKNQIFAFYLVKKGQETEKRKSVLTIGYYDKTKYTGDLLWNPVKYKHLYTVKLDDIKINGKSTNICNEIKYGPDGCLITFDSGSVSNSIPDIAVKVLVQKGVPINFVPCKNAE